MVRRDGDGGSSFCVFCVAVERLWVRFSRVDSDFMVEVPVRVTDGGFELCRHRVGVDECKCLLARD